MTLRALLALGFVAPLASASLGSAQTSVVDEGSFRISVRGSTIGTETFTIRRSGAGANGTTVAQGRLILDSGEQTRTVIQFRGPELRPTAYQIEVTGANRQSITGRIAGNRFRATIVSSAGEQMREYLVDRTAAIVDDGLVHQHYFVVAASAGTGSISVILPRQSRQVDARIGEQASETINIAGKQVTARRIHVQIPGLDDRTVWVDGQNRVLRVRIPAQELTAERADLP